MNRVLRGGSWNNNAQNCRVAARGYAGPDGQYDDVGFRLVLSL